MQKATGLLVFVLLLFTLSSFSQKTDSTKSTSHFSGSVGVTNNGISLIPTFPLGKPATILNLSTLLIKNISKYNRHYEISKFVGVEKLK